jgi:hypothetical protein
MENDGFGEAIWTAEKPRKSKFRAFPVRGKKKEPVVRDGIKFDSAEELEFYIWCKEAEKAGIIISFEYHPAPIVLYTKEKDCPIKTQTYAADFILMFPNPKSPILFNSELIYSPVIDVAFIEIKGTTGFRAVPKAGDISFPIKQAWLWATKRIYVNKIIVQHKFNKKGKILHAGFFSKTWVPEELAWMKNRKERTRVKAFEDCKLLKDLQERK